MSGNEKNMLCTQIKGKHSIEIGPDNRLLHRKKHSNRFHNNKKKLLKVNKCKICIMTRQTPIILFKIHTIFVST